MPEANNLAATYGYDGIRAWVSYPGFDIFGRLVFEPVGEDRCVVVVIGSADFLDRAPQNVADGLCL